MKIGIRRIGLLVVLLWISNSKAQTPYTLTGIVIDESDNLLANIPVTLQPHGIQTLCGPNGEFTITLKPAHAENANAPYSLGAQEVGYQDASMEISLQQLAAGQDDLVLELVTNPVTGDVIGFSVDIGGENADFYVYVPDAVDTIRAALYVSHHGMGDITRADMKQFAAQEELALVGFFGNPVQRGMSPVSLVDDYIDSLAVLCGHPELPDAPIMTFGHSNGTGFAASWPRDRPEQIIAWLGYHPGFNDYLKYENTWTVPSMIMVGTSDGYFNPAFDPTDNQRRGSRQDTVVYNLRENYDAPMNIMVEGGIGHAASNLTATWEFIYEFYRAAMRVRLADDGTLKSANISAGWLGDHYDLDVGGRQNLEVAAYADYAGDVSRANWLPDELFAKHWQCYGETEKIYDEVIIDVPVGPDSNLARLGVATQSSTDYGGAASRAIDGNTNGVFVGKSVTHTEEEVRPWWQVDLRAEYRIGTINVYGRTDACCADRLSDYTVFVLNAEGDTTFSQDLTTYPEVILDAGGAWGEVVGIVVNDSSVLSLAEVEVFESEESPVGNKESMHSGLPMNEISVNHNFTDKKLQVYISNRMSTGFVVTNLSGQVIRKGVLNDEYSEIDLASFGIGVFLVRFTNAHQVFTQIILN